MLAADFRFLHEMRAMIVPFCSALPIGFGCLESAAFKRTVFSPVTRPHHVAHQGHSQRNQAYSAFSRPQPDGGIRGLTLKKIGNHSARCDN